MKVCIPTMDDKGLDGVPCGHFGSAPYFTFVDTETNEVESVPNGGSGHAHGQCRPLAFMGTRPVDAVLCRGIGRGAFNKLQDGGIQVFLTQESNVAAILATLKDGTLQKMGPDGLCGGHGHGNEQGHGQGGHCHDHSHQHQHGANQPGGGGRGWQ